MTSAAIQPPIFVADIFSNQALIQACLSQQAAKVVLVTDTNVGPLYADKLLQHLKQHNISCICITIAAGEASKSRESKAHIEDTMLAHGCGRDTLMIALGGGVITDLTGFVAATYCRGIPVIYIPSSLMAMVDAAHGGKTGINTALGKNLIGTFTPPKAVFIDVAVLATLPDGEYLAAFAEVIKHALIHDRDYFHIIAANIGAIKAKEPNLLTQIIHRSCEIKLNIVTQDCREQGKRSLLNFGHTIAHALELTSNFAIPHGQAVAAGILAESLLAREMGLLPPDDFNKINQLILKLGITGATLSMLNKQPFNKKDLRQALMLDKKSRLGQPRFVLLKSIGEVAMNGQQFTHAVDDNLLDSALDLLLSLENTLCSLPS
jgi:3-dehydroquinate synthase